MSRLGIETPSKMDENVWKSFFEYLEKVPRADCSENAAASSSTLMTASPTLDVPAAKSSISSEASSAETAYLRANYELGESQQQNVVVLSDSDTDDEPISSKSGYKRLREKARRLVFHRFITIFMRYSNSSKEAAFAKVTDDHLFPYERLKELSKDLHKFQQEFANNEKESSFLWNNVVQWLLAVKLSLDPMDLNNERFNLILIDLMVQYLNYITSIFCNINDETKIKEKVSEVVQTLTVILNGNVSHVLMVLLRIELKAKYRSILVPIFRKYLTDRSLRHTSNDLVVYLRLIFCFKRWKMITPLKTDREAINDIAVGKSMRSLRREGNTDVVDLTNEFILPKSVPRVNVHNESFISISDLIGFAIKHKTTGTRILLVYTSLDLENAISKYFQLYERYVSRNASADVLETLCNDTNRLHMGTDATNMTQCRNIQRVNSNDVSPSQPVRQRERKLNDAVGKASKRRSTLRQPHLFADCDTNKSKLNNCTIGNVSNLRSKNTNTQSDITLSFKSNSTGKNLLNNSIDLTINEDEHAKMMVLSSSDEENSVRQVSKKSNKESEHNQNSDALEKSLTTNENILIVEQCMPRIAAIPPRCRPLRKEKNCIPGEVSSTTSPDFVMQNKNLQHQNEESSLNLAATSEQTSTSFGFNQSVLEVHSAGGILQNGREVGVVKALKHRVDPCPPANQRAILLGLYYDDVSSENDDEEESGEKHEDEIGAKSQNLSHRNWKVVKEATSSTSEFPKILSNNVIFSTRFDRSQFHGHTSETSLQKQRSKICSDDESETFQTTISQTNESNLKDLSKTTSTILDRPTCSKYIQRNNCDQLNDNEDQVTVLEDGTVNDDNLMKIQQNENSQTSHTLIIDISKNTDVEEKDDINLSKLSLSTGIPISKDTYQNECIMNLIPSTTEFPEAVVENEVNLNNCDNNTENSTETQIVIYRKHNEKPPLITDIPNKQSDDEIDNINESRRNSENQTDIDKKNFPKLPDLKKTQTPISNRSLSVEYAANRTDIEEKNQVYLHKPRTDFVIHEAKLTPKQKCARVSTEDELLLRVRLEQTKDALEKDVGIQPNEISKITQADESVKNTKVQLIKNKGVLIENDVEIPVAISEIKRTDSTKKLSTCPALKSSMEQSAKANNNEQNSSSLESNSKCYNENALKHSKELFDFNKTNVQKEIENKNTVSKSTTLDLEHSNSRLGKIEESLILDSNIEISNSENQKIVSTQTSHLNTTEQHSNNSAKCVATDLKENESTNELVLKKTIENQAHRGEESTKDKITAPKFHIFTNVGTTLYQSIDSEALRVEKQKNTSFRNKPDLLIKNQTDSSIFKDLDNNLTLDNNLEIEEVVNKVVELNEVPPMIQPKSDSNTIEVASEIVKPLCNVTKLDPPGPNTFKSIVLDYQESCINTDKPHSDSEISETIIPKTGISKNIRLNELSLIIQENHSEQSKSSEIKYANTVVKKTLPLNIASKELHETSKDIPLVKSSKDFGDKNTLVDNVIIKESSKNIEVSLADENVSIDSSLSSEVVGDIKKTIHADTEKGVDNKSELKNVEIEKIEPVQQVEYKNDNANVTKTQKIAIEAEIKKCVTNVLKAPIFADKVELDDIKNKENNLGSIENIIQGDDKTKDISQTFKDAFEIKIVGFDENNESIIVDKTEKVTAERSEEQYLQKKKISKEQKYSTSSVLIKACDQKENKSDLLKVVKTVEMTDTSILNNVKCQANQTVANINKSVSKNETPETVKVVDEVYVEKDKVYDENESNSLIHLNKTAETIENIEITEEHNDIHIISIDKNDEMKTLISKFTNKECIREVNVDRENELEIQKSIILSTNTDKNYKTKEGQTCHNIKNKEIVAVVSNDRDVELDKNVAPINIFKENDLPNSQYSAAEKYVEETLEDKGDLFSVQKCLTTYPLEVGRSRETDSNLNKNAKTEELTKSSNLNNENNEADNNTIVCLESKSDESEDCLQKNVAPIDVFKDSDELNSQYSAAEKYVEETLEDKGDLFSVQKCLTTYPLDVGRSRETDSNLNKNAKTEELKKSSNLNNENNKADDNAIVCLESKSDESKDCNKHSSVAIKNISKSKNINALLTTSKTKKCDRKRIMLIGSEPTMEIRTVPSNIFLDFVKPHSKLQLSIGDDIEQRTPWKMRIKQRLNRGAEFNLDSDEDEHKSDTSSACDVLENSVPSKSLICSNVVKDADELALNISKLALRKKRTESGSDSNNDEDSFIAFEYAWFRNLGLLSNKRGLSDLKTNEEKIRNNEQNQNLETANKPNIDTEQSFDQMPTSYKEEEIVAVTALMNMKNKKFHNKADINVLPTTNDTNPTVVANRDQPRKLHKVSPECTTSLSVVPTVKVLKSAFKSKTNANVPKKKLSYDEQNLMNNNALRKSTKNTHEFINKSKKLRSAEVKKKGGKKCMKQRLAEINAEFEKEITLMSDNIKDTNNKLINNQANHLVKISEHCKDIDIEAKKMCEKQSVDTFAVKPGRGRKKKNMTKLELKEDMQNSIRSLTPTTKNKQDDVTAECIYPVRLTSRGPEKSVDKHVSLPDPDRIQAQPSINTNNMKKCKSKQEAVANKPPNENNLVILPDVEENLNKKQKFETKKALVRLKRLNFKNNVSISEENLKENISILNESQIKQEPVEESELILLRPNIVETKIGQKLTNFSNIRNKTFKGKSSCKEIIVRPCDIILTEDIINAQAYELKKASTVETSRQKQTAEHIKLETTERESCNKTWKKLAEDVSAIEKLVCLESKLVNKAAKSVENILVGNKGKASSNDKQVSNDLGTAAIVGKKFAARKTKCTANEVENYFENDVENDIENLHKVGTQTLNDTRTIEKISKLKILICKTTKKSNNKKSNKNIPDVLEAVVSVEDNKSSDSTKNEKILTRGKTLLNKTETNQVLDNSTTNKSSNSGEVSIQEAAAVTKAKKSIKATKLKATNLTRGEISEIMTFPDESKLDETSKTSKSNKNEFEELTKVLIQEIRIKTSEKTKEKNAEVKTLENRADAFEITQTKSKDVISGTNNIIITAASKYNRKAIEENTKASSEICAEEVEVTKTVEYTEKVEDNTLEKKIETNLTQTKDETVGKKIKKTVTLASKAKAGEYIKNSEGSKNVFEEKTKGILSEIRGGKVEVAKTAEKVVEKSVENKTSEYEIESKQIKTKTVTVGKKTKKTETLTSKAKPDEFIEKSEDSKNVFENKTRVITSEIRVEKVEIVKTSNDTEQVVEKCVENKTLENKIKTKQIKTKDATVGKKTKTLASTAIFNESIGNCEDIKNVFEEKSKVLTSEINAEKVDVAKTADDTEKVVKCVENKTLEIKIETKQTKTKNVVTVGKNTKKIGTLASTVKADESIENSGDSKNLFEEKTKALTSETRVEKVEVAKTTYGSEQVVEDNVENKSWEKKIETKQTKAKDVKVRINAKKIETSVSKVEGDETIKISEGCKSVFDDRTKVLTLKTTIEAGDIPKNADNTDSLKSLVGSSESTETKTKDLTIGETKKILSLDGGTQSFECNKNTFEGNAKALTAQTRVNAGEISDICGYVKITEVKTSDTADNAQKISNSLIGSEYSGLTHIERNHEENSSRFAAVKKFTAKRTLDDQVKTDSKKAFKKINKVLVSDTAAGGDIVSKNVHDCVKAVEKIAEVTTFKNRVNEVENNLATDKNLIGYESYPSGSINDSKTSQFAGVKRLTENVTEDVGTTKKIKADETTKTSKFTSQIKVKANNDTKIIDNTEAAAEELTTTEAKVKVAETIQTIGNESIESKTINLITIDNRETPEVMGAKRFTDKVTTNLTLIDKVRTGEASKTCESHKKSFETITKNLTSENKLQVDDITSSFYDTEKAVERSSEAMIKDLTSGITVETNESTKTVEDVERLVLRNDKVDAAKPFILSNVDSSAITDKTSDFADVIKSTFVEQIDVAPFSIGKTESKMVIITKAIDNAEAIAEKADLIENKTQLDSDDEIQKKLDHSIEMVFGNKNESNVETVTSLGISSEEDSEKTSTSKSMVIEAQTSLMKPDERSSEITTEQLDRGIDSILGQANRASNQDKTTRANEEEKFPTSKQKLGILTAQKINALFVERTTEKSKNSGFECDLEKSIDESISKTFNKIRRTSEGLTIATTCAREHGTAKKTVSKKSFADVKIVSANVPERVFADDESDNSSNGENSSHDSYFPSIPHDDVADNLKGDTVELPTNLEEANASNLETLALSSISDISTDPYFTGFPDILDQMLQSQTQAQETTDCMISGKNYVQKWSESSYAHAHESFKNKGGEETKNLGAVPIPAPSQNHNICISQIFESNTNAIFFDEADVSTNIGFDLDGNVTVEDLLAHDSDDLFPFSELDKSNSRSNSFSSDSETCTKSLNDACEDISHATKTIACDHSYNKEAKEQDKNKTQIETIECIQGVKNVSVTIPSTSNSMNINEINKDLYKMLDLDVGLPTSISIPESTIVERSSIHTSDKHIPLERKNSQELEKRSVENFISSNKILRTSPKSTASKDMPFPRSKLNVNATVFWRKQRKEENLSETKNVVVSIEEGNKNIFTKTICDGSNEVFSSNTSPKIPPDISPAKIEITAPPTPPTTETATPPISTTMPPTTPPNTPPTASLFIGPTRTPTTLKTVSLTSAPTVLTTTSPATISTIAPTIVSITAPITAFTTESDVLPGSNSWQMNDKEIDKHNTSKKSIYGSEVSSYQKSEIVLTAVEAIKKKSSCQENKLTSIVQSKDNGTFLTTPLKTTTKNPTIAIQSQPIITIHSQTNRLQRMDQIPSQCAVNQEYSISPCTRNETTSREHTPTLDEELFLEERNNDSTNSSRIDRSPFKRENTPTLDEPPQKKICLQVTPEKLSSNEIFDILKKEPPINIAICKLSSNEVSVSSDSSKVLMPVSSPPHHSEEVTIETIEEVKEDKLSGATKKIKSSINVENVKFQRSNSKDLTMSTDNQIIINTKHCSPEIVQIDSKERATLTHHKTRDTKSSPHETVHISRAVTKRSASFDNPSSSVETKTMIDESKLIKSRVTASNAKINALPSTLVKPSGRISPVLNKSSSTETCNRFIKESTHGIEKSVTNIALNNKISQMAATKSPSDKMDISTLSPIKVSTNISKISPCSSSKLQVAKLNPKEITTPTLNVNNRYHPYSHSPTEAANNRNKYVYQRVPSLPEVKQTAKKEKTQFSITAQHQKHTNNIAPEQQTQNNISKISHKSNISSLATNFKLSDSDEKEIAAKLKAYSKTLPPAKIYREHVEQRLLLEKQEEKLRLEMRLEYLEREKQRQIQQYKAEAQRLKRKVSNESLETHYKKFESSSKSSTSSCNRQQQQHQQHQQQPHQHQKSYNRKVYVNKFSEIEKKLAKDSSRKCSSSITNETPLTTPTAWEPTAPSVDEIMEHLSRMKKS